MASINDLATAATIASSAVALQSSPTQESAQLASPTSPSPASQLEAEERAAAAAASIAALDSSDNKIVPPSSIIEVKEAGISPDADVGPSVLAAPQVSQSPSQAQIPASPAPPPSSGAAGAESEAGGGALTADQQGGEPVSSPATAARDIDAMDGVEKTTTTTMTGAMLPKPVRGAFLVFEGMDRAGKTTQAKLLQQRCVESGREVRFMRFPDRTTPIGQMIDSYLKGQAEIEDHVIHLLFSANRWEAVKKIRAELEAGHSVVCDRFYHSGIVYSAAKQLQNLTLSWAKAPEIGLPRPDMVLFLDLEESSARERGGWGGEVYEKGEMQRRVRELFWGLSMGDLGNNSNRPGSSSSGVKAISSRRDSRVGGGPTLGGSNGISVPEVPSEFRQEEEDIQIVDADMNVEELSEKVWEVVLPRLEAVERGEVGKTVRIVR